MVAVIQVGNSDNKLTQQQWAQYVIEVGDHIGRYETACHFFGGPPTIAPWQNACWVIEIDKENLGVLKHYLTKVRAAYQQESVAVTVGETLFV